jgi:hypothetical protein
MKPTLEVGRWYKHNSGGYLFIEEIVEKLTEDIFNKSASNW